MQDEIIHEAQTMRSYNHPNVLPLYTSFVHGQELWMVTPFVGGGSVMHIMKYAYPEVSGLISADASLGVCWLDCLESLLLALGKRSSSSCMNLPATLAGPGRGCDRNHWPRGAESPRLRAQKRRHPQGCQGGTREVCLRRKGA